MKRTNTWLAWALAVGLLAFMLGSATASRGKINETNPIFGYGTGSALHLDAIQAAGTGPRIADAELAFSSANVNSDGFPAQGGVSEMNVNLQPPADHFTPAKSFVGKAASARGAGLQLGLGSDLPTDAGDVLSQTEAGAIAPPPDTETHDAGLGDTLAPLAYASLLHTEANANWVGTGNPCTSTISSPISFGRGYAADAQLLNTGGSNPDGSFQAPVVATDELDPNRSVVQSRSFTYAIPNGQPGRFGLVSEIHQTFAPISLARGPLPPLVIEVLGEWVFKATATGLTDGATIQYYALDDATGQPVTPTTTVIRISNDGGTTWTNLTAQDVFGNGGLVVPVAPLLSLAVGEDPRGIAQPNAVPDPTTSPFTSASQGANHSGRLAFGAVDVVRLSALDVGTAPLTAETHLADLRIGHFEAAVGVPQDGFSCTADTTTTSSTTSTSTTSTSTTSTTVAPTTTTSTSTTSTTAPTSTTSSTVVPSTTSTTRASTTSSSAKPTTSTSTPVTAPPATPVNVQPKTVG